MKVYSCTDTERAIAHFERSIRLSPRDPEMAVTLTGIGGLAGLFIGWSLAKLVSLLVPALYMVIPLWAAAFGFFGSVTVGLVFGLWPAMKAARLDPITALRHE